MSFKTLIVINLLLILASLGTGVFYLRKDGDEQTRVVKTLTIRVVLSFSLIALIIAGYLMGEIRPHGIQ
jgi:O-antigen/teichoic acid export membrane protein